jgi:hypothetical protein
VALVRPSEKQKNNRSFKERQTREGKKKGKERREIKG